MTGEITAKDNLPGLQFARRPRESGGADKESTQLPRAVLQNVVLVAVAVSVCLAVLEGGVRLFHIAPPPRGDAGSGIQALVEFDPVLETRYKPNSEARIRSPYGEFDVSYRTNELGLRDEALREPRSSCRRVLVLGNSFAEGWGVSESARFVNVAQAALRDHPPAGPAQTCYRLVNAGVAAYGMAQSYLLMQQLLEPVKPQALVVVLVGTMTSADYNYLREAATDSRGLATGLSAEAILSGGTPEREFRPSWETSTPVQAISRASAAARLVVQRLVNRAASGHIVPGDPVTDVLAAFRVHAEALDRLFTPTLAHLSGVAGLAKQRAIPLLVVHLPMPFQISDEEWKLGRSAFKVPDHASSTEESRLIEAFCREASLQCLFADGMIAAKAARTAQSPHLYFSYDFHLNEAGNKVVGEWLGAALAQWLPGG